MCQQIIKKDARWLKTVRKEIKVEKQQDLGKFGFEKCAVLVMKKGKWSKSGGIKITRRQTY